MTLIKAKHVKKYLSLKASLSLSVQGGHKVSKAGIRRVAAYRSNQQSDAGEKAQTARK